MKKLLIALCFTLGFAGLASAQEAKKKSQLKPASTENVKPAKVATTEHVPLKADGTPDKRYKANKPRGPLKKDGTPDKRFKANKN